MFDPDWTVLTSEDLDLLERWVSQQAGGLILVAGPVFHPKWTRLRTDPRVAKIAGLFPVTFSTRGAVVSSGRQGGEAAWPLELTPEARRAEFLWLDGDFDSSVRVWNDFQGVYDYVDTKEAKPASKVYAYFSDPTARKPEERCPSTWRVSSTELEELTFRPVARCGGFAVRGISTLRATSPNLRDG